MAEVLQLESDEIPSDKWALVELDRSRGMTGAMMDAIFQHSCGVTFYVPAPYEAPQLASAIDEAKRWADRNGIPTVYVSADAASLGSAALAI